MLQECLHSRQVAEGRGNALRMRAHRLPGRAL